MTLMDIIVKNGNSDPPVWNCVAFPYASKAVIPNVGHGNILVRHAIFWWDLFRDQVNGLLSFLHVNYSKIFDM